MFQNIHSRLTYQPRNQKMAILNSENLTMLIPAAVWLFNVHHHCEAKTNRESSSLKVCKLFTVTKLPNYNVCASISFAALKSLFEFGSHFVIFALHYHASF